MGINGALGPLLPYALMSWTGTASHTLTPFHIFFHLSILSRLPHAHQLLYQCVIEFPSQRLPPDPLPTSLQTNTLLLLTTSHQPQSLYSPPHNQVHSYFERREEWGNWQICTGKWIKHMQSGSVATEVKSLHRALHFRQTALSVVPRNWGYGQRSINCVVLCETIRLSDNPGHPLISFPPSDSWCS